MLSVTIYADLGDPDPQVFTEVDYVSLVNDETYGPPPLIAPNRGDAPLAKVGDRVMYINTHLVPLFEIERTGDDD